jgi:hypothetical protein
MSENEVVIVEHRFDAEKARQRQANVDFLKLYLKTMGCKSFEGVVFDNNSGEFAEMDEVD